MNDLLEGAFEIIFGSCSKCGCSKGLQLCIFGYEHYGVAPSG